MSKIGKLPVNVSEGVTVEISGQDLKVSGVKGSLERKIPKGIKISQEGGTLNLVASPKNKSEASVYGTTRALVNNMVKGVKDGWVKELELVGIGYRAEVVGRDLVLTVGYSHPVKIVAPEGISFKVEKTFITIDGSDRELVGQIAANVRAVRPPEPYKGKGIKYKDEVIKRKAGKAAKATTGPA